METYKIYHYDKFGNYMLVETTDPNFADHIKEVGGKVATKRQITAEAKKAATIAKKEADALKKLEKEDKALAEIREKKVAAAIKKYPELEGLIQ